MTMSYDIQYLHRCTKLIEEKLGWPDAGEWRNFEFNALSEKIYEATEVQLSTTTLKRLFGKVKYESLPSSATLNTLARYLGYHHWMEFKTAQDEQNFKMVEEKSEEAVIRRSPSISRRTFYAAAAVVTLVVICGFVFLSNSSTSTSPSSKDIIFKSRPLANGLPNSVVFNVDLKEKIAENILIQQSWDSTKTVRLQPGQSEATAIYYIPGYFRAKLIIDKKIVQEHDLFIRSNEWMATIDHDPVPTYVQKNELILNSSLHVSGKALAAIKQINTPTILTYHLVRPFKGLHSDNYTLQTSFQNIYGEGPAICKTVKVFILCTNGAFIIPFSIPGCVSDINLKLGNRTWPGKSNDLSAFGIETSKMINLEVEVKNRNVKINVNGKLIREESYQTNAGDIVGLRYSFLGAGMVDNIRLLNERYDTVYSNLFADSN